MLAVVYLGEIFYVQTVFVSKRETDTLSSEELTPIVIFIFSVWYIYDVLSYPTYTVLSVKITK